jgi:hypothetical protein
MSITSTSSLTPFLTIFFLAASTTSLSTFYLTVYVM